MKNKKRKPMPATLKLAVPPRLEPDEGEPVKGNDGREASVKTKTTKKPKAKSKALPNPQPNTLTEKDRETMRNALHSAKTLLDERAEPLLDSADSILCTVQSTEQTLSGPLAFAASSIIEDAIRSVKSAKGSIDDARRVLFELRYGKGTAGPDDGAKPTAAGA